MNSIAISSGHSLRVRGAKGFMDEVEENRRVTDRVTTILRGAKVTVASFHDDVSTTVASNLNTINNWHNAQRRDRDVSVHFNAFAVTENPRGTEVLHRNQPILAANVSRAMADAGRFINRGAKHRTDLSFLNRAQKPAILLEVCFVDSRADTNLYRQHFEAVCRSIAQSISGATIGAETPQPVTPTPPASARPTLRQGSRGDDVRVLQRALSVTADGVFGPVTDRAVRAFQSRHSLVVDGIVGKQSWAALGI